MPKNEYTRQKIPNTAKNAVFGIPGSDWLKDAQKIRLFSGGENHDFLLSEDVFGGVFC